MMALVLGFCGACSGEASIADATRAATPHLGAFGRFERWAQRVATSDVRLRGAEALREATFAPLRSDAMVLWADLQSDPKTRSEFARPIQLGTLKFQHLEARELGALKVAVSPDCRPGVRCVVIEREQDATHPFGIRIAFRLDAPRAQAKEAREQAGQSAAGRGPKTSRSPAATR